MTALPSPVALTALVEGSPTAVAAHNSDAWLALFSRAARVCDPYGSAPAYGTERLTRFYATFIAPNDISFDVEHDVVAGMTVFRDLTLTTLMSGKVALRVPMHLRYDVVAEAVKLGPKLLRNQGIAGTLGFLRGFRRVGRAGKRAAEEVFTQLKAGHAIPGLAMECPGGGGPAFSSEIPDFTNLTWCKLISAGDTVTATIELGGARGIALLDFAHGRRRVSRARFYLPR